MTDEQVEYMVERGVTWKTAKKIVTKTMERMFDEYAQDARKKREFCKSKLDHLERVRQKKRKAELEKEREEKKDKKEAEQKEKREEKHQLARQKTEANAAVREEKKEVKRKLDQEKKEAEKKHREVRRMEKTAGARIRAPRIDQSRTEISKAQHSMNKSANILENGDTSSQAVSHIY